MPKLNRYERGKADLRNRIIYCLLIVSFTLAGSFSFNSSLLAQEKLKNQLCGLFSAKLGSDDQIKYSSSTGDRTLDRQLSAEGQRLSTEFQIRPGIKIIESEGAFADQKSRVAGTRGTVLLGREFLFGELERNRRGWGGLVIAGVMAHEFAHIYQFFNGYRTRLLKGASTVKPLELHADFLAGYHLGLKRRLGSSMDIGAFMDGAYMLGDENTHDYQHHGTPKERRRAVREGYKMGIDGVTVDNAAEVGVKVVRNIMKSKF